MMCKELQRINTFIGKMADDKFARLDVQRTGQVRGSFPPNPSPNPRCHAARDPALP